MVENCFYEKKSKPISLVRVYCSFSIFLFSSIALVVPSGFSCGAVLLVLGSLSLLHLRHSFSLQRHDWIFVLTLAGYVLINMLLNIYHDLPANAYDKLLRYLLVIPVYFLLIACLPKQHAFWLGLVLGGVGAGVIAIYQQIFFDPTHYWNGRSSGFMNAIQFGDISMLISGLSMMGVLWGCQAKDKVLSYVLVFSVVMSVAASIFSYSRGGWIVLPFIFCILYFACGVSLGRKSFILILLGILVSSIIIYILLPESGLLKTRILAAANEVLLSINGSEKYTSVSIRFRMWENGLDAFKVHPISGWGDLDKIMLSYPDVWVDINKVEKYNHLHNEYIDTLVKKGLVGFTALMAMYLIPLYYFIGLMRTRQTDVMPFAAAGVVLILCVMVFGLTQCFLAHHSGTMVFVFYLVILKAYCRNIVAARPVAGVDVNP